MEYYNITDDDTTTTDTSNNTTNANDYDSANESEENEIDSRLPKIKSASQQWKEIFQQTKEHIKASTTKSAQKSEPKQLRQTQIAKPENFAKENLPFGDDITTHMEYEGILFHNINGVKDAHNWYQITTTMKELNMACFGFAEINTSMKGYLFHKWNDITRKTFRVSRAIASESDVVTETEYKPGGTITIMVDKWQARVTKMGSDERGLG
jgi:hypothetical protein